MSAADWLQGGGNKPTSATPPGIPSPTPTPTPSGTVTLKGYTPDWGGLLHSDPAYLAWENNANRSIGDAAAARSAAIKALAIDTGALPTGFSDPYGDLDQTTLNLAKNNQFSQSAVLDRNYTQGVQQMEKALAARNALDSGDLVYGQQQADFNHGQQEYNLGQSFSTQLANIVNAFKQAQDTAWGGEQQAITDASNNVYANPANRPTPDQTLSLEPNWIIKYGAPTYSDANGGLYQLDANGNPQAFTPNQPNVARRNLDFWG